MIKQKTLLLLLLCQTFFYSYSLNDKNKVYRISSDFIHVTFDETDGKLALATLDENVFFETKFKSFVKDKTKTIKSHEISNLGFSNSIEIHLLNGEIKLVSLIDGVPFAFLETIVVNSSKRPLKVDKIDICDAKILPMVEDSKLRVLGTGGLTLVNEQPNSGKKLHKKPYKINEASRVSPAGSYMFLSIANPETRSGFVGGWISSNKGSGIIHYFSNKGTTNIRASIDYGRLNILEHSNFDTEVLALGYFKDCRLGLESYADIVANYYEIELNPQLDGYCTWYSRPNGRASDENKIIELSEDAKKKLKPYGFDFIQIDDKWQRGLYKNGPRRVFVNHREDGPYPNGMKPVAEKIKNMGLTPGIWWMPFAGTFDDDFFSDKQYLFSKNQDGTPYVAKWGGAAFDLTNPKTLKYVGDISHRLANDWGYKYFKIDGLWMGTSTKNQYGNNEYIGNDHLGEQIVENPNITPIESYRLGLKTIRDTVGKDVFILGCNTSQNMRVFGASFGLMDAMRIGPDNKPEWKYLKMGPWHGTNRYFLHGKVWYNDPDPLYVRNEMPIEHSKVICSWVSISGQLNVFSEWLPDLNPERLHLLQRTLPSHGLTARPVDLFEEFFPKIWELDNPVLDQKIVAVFNWEDDTELGFNKDLEKLGLDSDENYDVYEYWTGSYKEVKENLKLKIPKASCRVFSIRKKKSHPQVISTSRHITQGIVDVVEEIWDEKTKTFLLKTKNIEDDNYEIRIVVPSAMEVDKVIFNKSEIPFELKGSLLIANVTTKITKNFEWEISFK
ncbi:hypothetical protein KFZ70_09275 [Tamlana fucoidanivorans]|uniref:Alpha-galactosidase n=1 Tax=Allotamlana fucoidanivorans TaxID=2583814 RepID=A0A5C4SQ54_9FLAO|nr:hypothetical protein [Tamlana fucoidanivorans]TNJ46056.1 hypothetical protein FGF67_03410 [Tamlana fucoidanivorans]